MVLTKKKKIFILAGMVVLLLVTGYLNIKLNTGGTVVQTSKEGYTTSSFFVTCKADRIATRNEAIEYYQGLINNQSASAESKLEAEQKIIALGDAAVIEMTIEGLIKAKGFGETLVNYSDTYINVIVQDAELTESETAQIIEIVENQVGRDSDFIKIIAME